jgi:putative membrane protein insertion efficiency factor
MVPKDPVARKPAKLPYILIRSTRGNLPNPLKLLIPALKKIIKVYYWAVSPWLGNRCRYVPSCSEYTMQALDQHGAIKGLWLSIKRIGRCHPWGGEGYDPVPGHSHRRDTDVDNNK